MDSLRERLEALDPRVKSFLEWRADGWLICLVDPSVPAMVSRVIEWSVMKDLGQTNMIILHAVNELRRKGQQLPLEADTALLAKILRVRAKPQRKGQNSGADLGSIPWGLTEPKL